MPLSREEITHLLRRGLPVERYRGRRLLVVIPDTTRSGPTSFFFHTLADILAPVAKQVDFLIALGTHPQIPKDALERFLNLPRGNLFPSHVGLFQHRWDDETQLVCLGEISASEMREISGGLLDEDIPVPVNRKVCECDEIILVGPVFPHEVVGMSGGLKYLFPGVSGPDFLHRFHWLGALITNLKINGVKDTPVRRAITRAASLVPAPITLVSYVVKDKEVYGLFCGDDEAWSAAADLSARLNIRYTDRSYRFVLSMAPLMYDDIWTAGKCMYKLEPVVEDGGTLVIHAPHITEVSYTHGALIRQVGYHTRDYFLCQMEKFRHIPGCILAHSTHVKGIGTFRNGVEKPRIEVVLATGIPEETCRRINLGYRDWRSISPEAFEGREDEGMLVVREAGEVLYRRADRFIPEVDKLS